MSDHQQYLDTLRRIPADVILSVATREMKMNSGKTCLCGWVIREQVARMTGEAPERVYPYDDKAGHAGAWSPEQRCAEFFGGTRGEWEAIYEGVIDETAPLIEEAFACRVAECAP